MPLSALKYYQREGLLPDGVKSAPNQVAYGEVHVQRVRLVKALLETGGLTVAATKTVIGALNAEGEPLAETFRIAQQELSSPRGSDSPPSTAAGDRVLALVRGLGWDVTEDNPGIAPAARALDGLDAISFHAPDWYIEAYASAAALAAAADLRALGERADTDAIAELMVVGSVLGDPLFSGLRRLAQEDVTHHLFPIDPKEVSS